MKKALILAVIFALFSVSPAFAILVNMSNAFVVDASGAVILEVGNLTKNYTLTAQVFSNESLVRLNATFYMPYGIMNITSCNGASGFTRVNTTTVSCEVATTESLTVPAPGALANVSVNLTIAANISAYTFYSSAQTFNFTFTSANVTGIVNSTTKSVTAVSARRNPRPEAVNTSLANATLIFTFWNQSDKGYEVMTPIYTYNPTLGRPVLSNNSYGEILYFDKSFFEVPSFMKLWSYNLTFRIIFNGATGAANFTVRSPINNTGPLAVQSLIPLFIQTFPQQDFVTNVTRNFTIGIPNPNSFTVYWNGTNYSQTVLTSTIGLNVSFTGAAQGLDQSTTLLSITIPNETVANMTNNTDVSILFTLSNITACGTAPCTTSPVFVNSQLISGWSPESPPQFGSSLNISYVINVTNPFTNYTLGNLSISIMQPMNVTMVGATTQQFNMTKLSSVKISVWNGSVFVENLSVVRRESNFSFSDAHGPSQANVTIYITTFDVVLSSNAHVNSSKGWEPNSNATVVINFTAEMAFPVLNETSAPSGAAGTTNQYNVTTNQPQRAPLNMTGKVPGLDSSATGINVTVDGVQVDSSNLTIGSLILKDVASGQHVISVSYTVPAAAAAATTTSSGGGGGGDTTPILKKVTNILSNALPDQENKITISSSDINIKNIAIVVAEKLSDVKFITTKLDDKPANISAPSGKAFQYVNITIENLPKEKLKSAKIGFTVLKSWLNSNNLSADDVSLLRYTTAWDKLPTTKTNETSTDVSYLADTPGFSTFAIAAQKVEAAPTPSLTPTPAPVATPSTTPTKITPTPKPTLAPAPSTNMLMLVLALVIAAVLIYLFLRKKPKKKNKE